MEKFIKFNLYLGLGIILISELLLFMEVTFIKNWFFSICWWSYILIIDSLNYRRNGYSLIFKRSMEFLFMAFISVFTWLIFEIINFRLNNWSYHNLPENIVKRWLGYFISYATVIPALWETAVFMESFFSRKKFRTFIKISNIILLISIFTGILSIILVLLFPRYFFPLVWLGFIFLITPINHILKIKGVIHCINNGNYGKIIAWLLTGLWAGILWEFWNYWAGSRWQYSIPYFNFLKIFEMPLLGYFGFPPFAIEVFAFYNLFSYLREKIKHYVFLKWTILSLLIAFDLICFKLIDSFTWLK
ncbi:hypothetical protein NLC82_00945 [Candidatus Aminicenantes bacterium AC-335-A11]|jgi:hypothetical protein|nr:hypothetical protein [SCandidatus Aminicenantes bacterium Aminicenantia_JdfR_composite]MCP2617970.1 hypothetical protein [Candidatus Aminicenantes bacterium AC-335-A11]